GAEGVDQDGPAHDPAPAEAVRQAAEDDASDPRGEQRNAQEKRLVVVERLAPLPVLADGPGDEGEEHQVVVVEHPAQQAEREGPPALAGADRRDRGGGRRPRLLAVDHPGTLAGAGFWVAPGGHLTEDSRAWTSTCVGAAASARARALAIEAPRPGPGPDAFRE